MAQAAALNPFADLPPVPLAGAAASAPSGVSGAVSFTDPSGPNPFADLPPVALAPANQNATPVASPHPGVLANAPDDNALTQAGKGAATAAIKGLGDIPGVIGNLNDVGEMAGNYLMGTARTAGQYIASKFTDMPVHTPSENAASTAAALESGRAQMRASGAPSPSDYVPTGQTFSNPVLAKTGEYVPTSPLGRIGMAGVEAGVGSVAPGASIAETAANAAKSFVPNLAAGAVGQTATEVTGNPLAGALAGPAAFHAGNLAASIAAKPLRALGTAIPPLTEAQGASRARATVGSELNAAATDPGAAQAKLAAGDTSQVPGAPLTTGPLSDDVGLNVYEKAVTEGSPEAKAAYGAHLAKQNAARQNAIASVQPTGNVADLPEAVRTNAAATDAASQAAVDAAQARAAANQATVDAATKAHVEGAQEAHQTALAGIQALKPDASPLEVAQHFRVIRDALEQSGSENVTSAQSAASQARSATAPVAQNPEQVGAALRAPYEAGNAAASAAVSKLYDALPKDMVAPSADIAARAKAIQAGMLPEHSPIAGEESRLYDLASGYGDSMSLANVNALRGSILSARSTLRQSDPQAYGRLGQLLPAVDDAIDTAVENRAALDAIAVRRGTMTESKALPAKLDKFHQAEIEWRNATQQPQALAAGGGLSGGNSGRSESVDLGGNGNSSQGRGGLGNGAGDQGVSSASGGTSPRSGGEGQQEPVGATPLREANAAYREKKQTFDEGPVGEAFSKVGRGEPAYSNAELAAKVFHAKPTAGEDARAYLKAAGPDGVPALSDAAAYSFHEAAKAPDGSFDPKRGQKWISDHEGALAELPDDVRAKFQDTATAHKTAVEALANARDNLDAFNTSEIGKIAGLEHGGDVAKRIGSILDSREAPEQRLADLAAKAKGNPAAEEGLKSALIQHVLDKFAPEGVEPKTAAMQAYVAAKEPTLSKVLSPEEIKAIADSAGKATAAGAEVKAAETGRAEALKGVSAEGEKALKTALDARKAMMAKYGEKTTLGKLAGTTSDDDAVNVVRSIIGADDGAARMASLAKEVAKTPGATDALKKTVAEVIRREAATTTEAGTSEVMQLNRAGLQRFLDKRTDALKAAGLTDAQVGALRNVTENALQMNRVLSAGKSGGSDTSFLEAAKEKLAKAGKLPILTRMAIDTAFGAVGGFAGHHLGAEGGAAAGAFMGGKLGDKVVHAMEGAGIKRLNQLRIQAILDPGMAATLMKEAPKQPNRDAAALLALRLRQMSMAGILAKQQH